jgi:hypothetical protein
VIRVKCPRCARGFAVEDAMRGRSDRCPQCATPVPVPASDRPPAAVSRRGVVVEIPPPETHRNRPDLDRYLDALAAAVEQTDLFPPTGPGADLFVPVKVKSGGKVDLSAYTDPGDLMPDSGELVRLFQALLAVPVPDVQLPDPRRPVVQVVLRFAVRGGTGRPHAAGA